MFKVYKRPPYYDERMNALARKYLEIGILFFTLVAIWSIGNKSIVEESNLISITYDKTAYKDKVVIRNRETLYSGVLEFFSRSLNLYGSPFTVIGLLLVFYWLIKHVFSEVLSFILSILFGCCFADKSFKKSKEGIHFELKVDDYEKEKEIKIIKNMKRDKWFINQAVATLNVGRAKNYEQMLQDNIRQKNETRRFGTLSSYNFRLNPEYVDYFIGYD